MPCQEFADAIAFKKQSIQNTVIIYFTRHFGTKAPTADIVHFASGYALVKDSPTPHLSGTLNVSKNKDINTLMVNDSTLTYDVDIFPDGKVTYLYKINGQPAGGKPAITIQATCYSNCLLTAEHDALFGPEIVTVGVDRKPSTGGTTGVPG